MYSQFFGTMIEHMCADIVLCLGAETLVQAMRFYNSELVLEKRSSDKKSASSVIHTSESYTNTRPFFGGDFQLKKIRVPRSMYLKEY